MPNIPTREPVRERTVHQQRPVQNNVQRPVVSQQRSTQNRTSAQQQNRVPVQQSRVNVQQARYGNTAQMPSQKPRNAFERIKPIQSPKSAAHKSSTAAKSSAPTRKKKKRRQRERTTMGDFLLSFIVALFVFGVAAIFVCNALISLFT